MMDQVIRDMAIRVRTRGVEGITLGRDLRDAVWNARNRADMFTDCQEIMQAFPQDFEKVSQ
jgi:hypothetical protein